MDLPNKELVGPVEADEDDREESKVGLCLAGPTEHTS